MILRRDLITMLGGAAIAWPLAVRAQEKGRTYRIGILSLSPRLFGSNAFYAALGRLGFVEGQNLQVDAAGYGLQPEQLAQHAAELVRAKVDVIFGNGGAASIRAAQQATKTIPILGLTDDMVGEGLAVSMAHPGGNTTGVSMLSTELDGKRQELLIDLLPGVRRIAALANSSTTLPSEIQPLREAARTRDVELVIETVGTSDEVVPAIDAAKAAGAAALNFLASPLVYPVRLTVYQHMAALRLPAMYQWPDMPREGGLAGYGPSLAYIYGELLPGLCAQLLRGTKPADLPIEQPTKFELVINLKTANALDLTVPQSLLARADEVIE